MKPGYRSIFVVVLVIMAGGELLAADEALSGAIASTSRSEAFVQRDAAC